MNYTFQIAAVPTGSLALRVQLMNDALKPNAVWLKINGDMVGPLQVYPGPYASILDVALTPPLPFDVLYDVEVFFSDVPDADVVAYIENVENPLPDRRRASVLRQRLYEVLSAAYDAGEIAAEPIGSLHGPGSINNKFKVHAGTVVEVGVGYIDSAKMNSHYEQENEVVIPLTGYAACDEMEDASVLMEDMEEVIACLMSSDWRLNGFQMNQSQAEVDAPRPSFTDDRKMIRCAGSVRVPMRRYVRQ